MLSAAFASSDVMIHIDFYSFNEWTLTQKSSQDDDVYRRELHPQNSTNYSKGVQVAREIPLRIQSTVLFLHVYKRDAEFPERLYSDVPQTKRHKVILSIRTDSQEVQLKIIRSCALSLYIR